MQCIESPSEERPRFQTLFLGGGITHVSDWQNVVESALRKYDVSIYNPRRDLFDVSNPREDSVQIAWEYKRLREADMLSFWFSNETIQPITLFELGAALERAQTIVLGIHPAYERRDDVLIQTRLRRPHLVIADSLESHIGGIRSLLDSRRIMQSDMSEATPTPNPRHS